MKHVSRTAILPYSTEQMFKLVNDVGSYDAFLPWCEKSEVLASSSAAMTARLTVRGAGLKQQFTTENTLEPFSRIGMVLREGPFSHLKGAWLFQPLGDDGCRISLSLSFDFDNRLANLAFGSVFEAATDKMVDAFSARATQLFGATRI